MSVAIVTGSAGLIGSEAVRFLHEKGFEVAGIDNNLREVFFGADGSTLWNRARLGELSRYTHHDFDIRDAAAVDRLFARHGSDVALVIHAAAQPSHDWAARDPVMDFQVNAVGTLNMLEACRKHAPGAAFLFTSTNKVYGDACNELPLVETATRWEVAADHPYRAHGIDENLRIDQSMHSVFGASKLAADVMVQEYGRAFGMRTAVFRGGCLTGPAHSGAELHGFLAYLVKCALANREYVIHGYKGKQVRDNIHSADLVSAFWSFFENPASEKTRGAVYNMGGGRASNCSMLEAIALIAELSGRELRYSLSEQNRAGDHIWWISDTRRFQADHPGWCQQYDLRRTLAEMIDAAAKNGSR
jgi:CDP-paratose 2-epimerase